MRTPEGVWDWTGKKRGELKSSGRYLTNREMFDYFRDSNIVKTHKLRTVIENHFLAMEFIKQLAPCESGDFQDDFGKFLMAIGEYLNTDAPGGRFSKSDVYDNAKLNLANDARAIPGSRGKSNDRGEKGKWEEEK